MHRCLRGQEGREGVQRVREGGSSRERVMDGVNERK